MPKNWSKWKMGNIIIYNLEIILFTYYFLSMCNTLEIRNIDCILQVRLKNLFLSKLFRVQSRGVIHNGHPMDTSSLIRAVYLSKVSRVGQVVGTDSTNSPGAVREMWDGRWRIIRLRQQARSTYHCYKEIPETTPLGLGVPQSYTDTSLPSSHQSILCTKRKPKHPGGLGTMLDLIPSCRMDVIMVSRFLM